MSVVQPMNKYIPIFVWFSSTSKSWKLPYDHQGVGATENPINEYIDQVGILGMVLSYNICILLKVQFYMTVLQKIFINNSFSSLRQQVATGCYVCYGVTQVCMYFPTAVM